MPDQELTPDQQDGLVGDLVESLDGMKLDEDEFEALYDQLDADHQREVDDAVRDFADNAVGDPSWRLTSSSVRCLLGAGGDAVDV